MKRPGQSLIEALIALSIVTTAFVGIMTLLSKSFSLNRVATDQTTATYLASEGIEVTKSLIDHDVYGGAGWGACCSLGGTYAVDYESTALTPYPNPVNNTTNYLYFSSSTGFYGYQAALGPTAVITKFNRWVQITSLPQEIEVDSFVEWSTGSGGNNTVHLEDQFYNWHP